VDSSHIRSFEKRSQGILAGEKEAQVLDGKKKEESKKKKGEFNMTTKVPMKWEFIVALRGGREERRTISTRDV